jgi:hypothetical protein
MQCITTQGSIVSAPSLLRLSTSSRANLLMVFQTLEAELRYTRVNQYEAPEATPIATPTVRMPYQGPVGRQQIKSGQRDPELCIL